MKKDYQRDLRDQIEHKRRMKELEERRRIEEEKLEELRVRKEQEELALKYLREKEGEFLKGDNNNPNENGRSIETPAPKIVIKNGRKMLKSDFEAMYPGEPIPDNPPRDRSPNGHSAERQPTISDEPTQNQYYPSPTFALTQQNPNTSFNPNLPQGAPNLQPTMQPTYAQGMIPVAPIFLPQYMMAPPQNVNFGSSPGGTITNEVLQKEVFDLKREINKYNIELSNKINEARKEVHEAIEDRNKAEHELQRLKMQLVGELPPDQTIPEHPVNPERVQQGLRPSQNLKPELTSIQSDGNSAKESNSTTSKRNSRSG